MGQSNYCHGMETLMPTLLSTNPQIRNRLREAGLRATTGRIAILEVLMDANRPMHHAEVAQAISDVQLNHSTVFRALTDMADAGLLRRLELGDHVWRYEPTVSRNPHAITNHPHFVCTICGQVKCLDGRPEFHANLNQIQGVGKITEILFKGRCLNCQNGSS
ncbi:MAG: transcriptional repressor [Planctomycetes bacterium]|nr:transcriptional repressor [Planctomycetota bacterium]